MCFQYLTHLQLRSGLDILQYAQVQYRLAEDQLFLDYLLNAFANDKLLGTYYDRSLLPLMSQK